MSVSSTRKTKKKRPRGVGDFQSGPESFKEQRHKKLNVRNSMQEERAFVEPGRRKPRKYPSKKASTDSVWKSKKHSCDTRSQS